MNTSPYLAINYKYTMEHKQTSKVENCKTSVLAAIFVFVLIGTLVPSSEAFSLTGLCIRNCGHCKEIYGDYFKGQACAESCLMSSGQSVPDCNNPATFNRFLKRYI